jgi:ornithine cyclodeaminase/alanine dehydrogenase-like protein (mu-crystallin family)
MLVLDNDAIRQALLPEQCEQAMVEALTATAEGRGSFPLRSVMAPRGAGAFLGLMPAHLEGQPGSFALKAVCIVPANHERGLDAHQGLVALFSGKTGEVQAVLNAAALTEIRTAAVSAAATRALARDPADVLAILGAGVQGQAHLRALRGVRRWREFRIHSRSSSRAQELAANARDLLGVPVVVAADARAAVDGADVVVLATTSREPVIERDWLARGAHVNAVGASSMNARELDIQTVADAAYFCDSRESVLHEALEFALAKQQGAIADDTHIRAELGEVLAGDKPGRQSPDELTVFRSLGVGIEDLAAAELAVRRATELGLGTEVQL